MMEISEPRCYRIVHSEASLGWGGQERRILAELVGFHRRGSRVWLLAPTESRIYLEAEKAGVSCRPLATGRLAFPREVLGVARWFREIRPMVVNTHSSRDGWLVGLAARLARVPWVIRTRHIDVEYPHPWISRHAFTTLADHVMTTSDRISRDFRERFSLPDHWVSTVPTGIDLAVFSPNVLPVTFASAPSGCPIVGMVSVLRSWKGHETFLQALALLRQQGETVYGVIVGDGPRREHIARRVADLGLDDRVEMLGHRDDVAAVLRALSVLVIPSTRHEGIPQIGLQALAVKTPVVGSDVGGIPEIIRPGETGSIFPGGDAAALARALLETLREKQRTQAMTECGRTMVEQQHGLDAMLDSISQLYQRGLRPIGARGNGPSREA